MAEAACPMHGAMLHKSKKALLTELLPQVTCFARDWLEGILNS